VDLLQDYLLFTFNYRKIFCDLFVLYLELTGRLNIYYTRPAIVFQLIHLSFSLFTLSLSVCLYVYMCLCVYVCVCVCKCVGKKFIIQNITRLEQPKDKSHFSVYRTGGRLAVMRSAGPFK